MQGSHPRTIASLMEDQLLLYVATRQAISRLPYRLALAVVMRDAYGFEFKEIAGWTGKSTNSARASYLRGKATLIGEIHGPRFAARYWEALRRCSQHR